MLMDSLTQSIKKMKQMDMVENAALDAEKKAKNDADYRTVVEDFFNTVNKLRQAVVYSNVEANTGVGGKGLAAEKCSDACNDLLSFLPAMDTKLGIDVTNMGSHCSSGDNESSSISRLVLPSTSLANTSSSRCVNS